MTTKPPFHYVGAKTSIAGKIAALLPEHTHYVEPFAGSLAVLLAKQPSVAETVIDRDDDLVAFWRVLRDSPLALARAVALTPHSRSEYYSTRDRLSDPDPVEHARRVFVRLTQSASRSLVPGMWARYVVYGRKATPFPAQIQRAADRICAVAERLRHVSIDSRDALAAIRMYGRSASTLLYLDPPYEGRERYRESVDHEQLLELATGVAARVVISGYASELYDERLAGWHRHEFASHAGGCGTKRVPRTEVVWVKPC